MSLIEAMKNKRKEMGLTQTQLGAALGVTQAMVAEIETGVTKLPLELVPMVRRFVASGALPSQRELAGRRQARPGK